MSAYRGGGRTPLAADAPSCPGGERRGSRSRLRHVRFLDARAHRELDDIDGALARTAGGQRFHLAADNLDWLEQQRRVPEIADKIGQGDQRGAAALDRQ